MISKNSKRIIILFSVIACVICIIAGYCLACFIVSSGYDISFLSPNAEETTAETSCDHLYTYWDTEIEPEPHASGLEVKKCLSCNEILDESVIPEIDYSLQEVKSLISENVIKVYTYDSDGKTVISQGSGFFINDEGDFVTNAHVIEGAYYVKIKTSYGSLKNVDKVYAYNNVSDYAFCHAEGVYVLPEIKFYDTVTKGEKVYAFGFPNDANSLIASEGVVTSPIEIVDGSPYCENTAYIAPGSSGGILTNAKGEVIAITTARSKVSESYFGVLYKSFKSDIESFHLSAKSPLELFHRVEEVRLSYLNFDKYFDIYVDDEPGFYSVNYTVYVVLKPQYQSKKVIFDGITSIRANIEIETTYTFYNTGYNPGWSSDSDVAYAYIYIFDFDNFQSSANVYSFLSGGVNKTDISYKYNVEISYASGNLVIYD